MNKKFLFTGSALLVILVLGILLWPLISGLIAVLYGMATVERLESRICSQEYYEPVAKDLAWICSNIESGDAEISEIDSTWWPDSVKKIEPLRGYLSSDSAGVLFTCGFSHLSYKLKKVHNDRKNSNEWELYFEDEGRNKHLVTIELSEHEPFDFNKMYNEAIKEYELKIKENPDSAQLRQSKETIKSLFNRAESKLIK